MAYTHVHTNKHARTHARTHTHIHIHTYTYDIYAAYVSKSDFLNTQSCVPNISTFITVIYLIDCGTSETTPYYITH